MNNRELKFRVWSLTEKCFIHNFFISNGFSQVWKIEGEIDSLEVYPLPDVIVQQFTGLFDKNNIPIYEGDILKYEYSQAECSSFALQESTLRFHDLYVVEYRDAAFRYKELKYGDISEDNLSMVVVGNIFLNPELI